MGDYRRDQPLAPKLDTWEGSLMSLKGYKAKVALDGFACISTS